MCWSEEKFVDTICDTDQGGGSQYHQGVPRVRVCGEEGQPQQSQSQVLEVVLAVLLAPTDPDHFEGGPDCVETELSPGQGLDTDYPAQPGPKQAGQEALMESAANNYQLSEWSMI